MLVKSLYELCLARSVQVYTAPNRFADDKKFRDVPDNVLFDIYFMLHGHQVFLLQEELQSWDVFARMLMVKHRRVDLLRIFQGIVDQCYDASFTEDLVMAYVRRIGEMPGPLDHILELGLNFAVFLLEGSWYKAAHDLLGYIQEFIGAWDTPNTWKRKLFCLECLQRRLFVESNYALFDNADRTLNSTNVLLKAVQMEAAEAGIAMPNLASLYATYTHLFTMRSEYDEAYNWGMKAIALLNSDVSKSTCLFVLRVVAKVCVVKRRYSEGNFLIQQALMLSKEMYQQDLHPNYADSLMLYGFFLLNYDNIKESVLVYRQALNVRQAVFGRNNIHVAFAYEELAYAHYVNEYSSGDFQNALKYADKATRILENLLPPHHLSLAYTKRVKGLILEEIALDLRDPSDRDQRAMLLMEAELLHKSALALSLHTFGQENVQTAKHYGNLGRIYQSLGDYQEAERMQLLAIRLKERILGAWDYEVGLSVGHLASLYNFHMCRFRDAERYYLRSIEIGVNLFGESYSGLEYDYRGLIKVYTQLEEPVLAEKYRDLMRKWREMRKAPVAIQRYDDLLPIQRIVRQFLKWDEDKDDAIAAAY